MGKIFYPVCIAGSIFLFAVSGGAWIWLYAGLLGLLAFALRPSSSAHQVAVGAASRFRPVLCGAVAAATIAACVAPMGELPLWNGENPGHRNQYELLAEAMLEGRVSLDYGDEAGLLTLENPYDPDERTEAGVPYHWDHAFYQGRYYMYFGVVPTLTVFLPYRALTGQSLTTYYATQLFAAIAIAGIFALFYQLSRRFFPELPDSVYLALAVAASVASVWYSAAEPALYCTAITSAIALEVWSLWFFVRAVYVQTRLTRQLTLAALGAALGALAFGCRPPVALANVLVIPLLVVFLRQRRFTPKLLLGLALAASPYVLVAAGLMWYNFIRFDNPLEFGQAYQLTVADQSHYRLIPSLGELPRIFEGIGENFFQTRQPEASFPYLRCGGVFANFPLFLGGFAVFLPPVWKIARREKLAGLAVALPLTAMLITVADVMWTPYLLERYRMDLYFLLGIWCFLGLGLAYRACPDGGRKYLSAGTAMLGAVSVLAACLLCVRTVGVYYPETVAAIANALHLS